MHRAEETGKDAKLADVEMMRGNRVIAVERVDAGTERPYFLILDHNSDQIAISIATRGPIPYYPNGVSEFLLTTIISHCLLDAFILSQRVVSFVSHLDSLP